MKRLSILIISIAVLSVNSLVFAAKNNETESQAGSQAQQQNQQQLQISNSPTANQVQNQNQVNTQNQGQDSQLQVEIQEQENLGEGHEEGLQNRNQNTIENMSEVAKQVQQLLEIREVGGIGEQVKQIAQEQNRVQIQIQEQLNKLESKSKLARFLTGTDYGAIKNLKAQLVQNQIRIKQLTQLQNQLSNQGDITMVQKTIQALVQENTSLQEIITAEEQTKSMFGWLFRFFAK